MRKKIWWIVLVAVFLMIGAIAYFKMGTSPLQWRTTVVKRGDLDVSILTTGTVQPENRLEIKSPVAGRLENILVTEGTKVKKGQILAWLSSTERAAMIDAARSKGSEEVKHWEELYKPTPIIAPISGMIILRNFESGQTFTTSDALLVMSDRLTVKAQVDETDLAQIQLKQNAQIRLDAYPDQAIPATVDQIAFEAKTVNNVTTYLITVLPNETPDFMRSGMTANVTFSVKSKKDILLIPNEFIKYDNGKPILLIKAEKGKPTDREVHLGVSDGKSSEVLSGVDEGETVVMMQPLGKAFKGTNPFSTSGNRPRGGGGR